MQFSYKRYPNPNGIDITRPVIPITLRNPRAPRALQIGYEALVDSGSDRCIFPAELADLLNIDLRTSTKILYVAGVVAGERRPIYLHPIEIEVGGRDGPAFEALAGFMPDFSKSGHGLLGRNGFFDQFSFVKFKDLDNVIEIGKWQRP